MALFPSPNTQLAMREPYRIPRHTAGFFGAWESFLRALSMAPDAILDQMPEPPVK